jgi:WD40-like Beta Propeller Repeat
MTTNDSFDRRLSDWLREDAAHRVPDHLDEVLVRTVVTHQRPWWSSLERWLPMDTTTSLRRFGRVPTGRLLLVALLAIALIGLLLLAVASRQRRLPEPFGVARNGAIVMSHDGDIYSVDSVDPVTHATRLLVGGSQTDFGPTFSRDGTQMMFLRGPAAPASDPGIDQGLIMVVADADGSNVRELTPGIIGLDSLDRSPDGRQIAFLSRKTANGPGLINVIGTDGNGLRTLDVGRPAHFISWLPPFGSEIVFRGEQLLSNDRGPGIFAVHADGTGLRELSRRAAENRDDYMTPAVSPDGSRVSYSSNGAVSHIHVLDLGTGRDIVLPDPSGGFTNQFGSAFFSPDGRLVGYLRDYPNDDTYQFVVAPADGSGTGTPIGPRLRQPFGDVNYAWVPDGTAVMVDYDRDGSVRMLPVDGSPATVLGRGPMSFADVQRLAP